jgi:glycosyltransferase involved in cell wall biosynthesis
MEGIPVALMEAMVSGVPVVATSISGIPELVRHGDTGWLVPPEDVEALAEALSQIHKDPAEAKRRACSGRRWVLDEFELSSNAKRLSLLFTQSSLSSSLG